MLDPRHQPDAAYRSGAADCPLRAVVFETAGVIYDATPRRRWLWQLVTHLGLRLSYDEFIGPWDRDFLSTVLCGERPYADALHEYLTSLNLSSADLSELEAAIPLRSQPLETGLRPLPGVARMLNRLSCEGFLLAVLSDCSLPGNELKEQLDGLGLGGRFGVVITSTDLGTVKPAGQNYDITAAALALRAEECAMVSSCADDLLGARARGWRTVGCGLGEDAQFDANVESVARLFDGLPGWMCGSLRSAG